MIPKVQPEVASTRVEAPAPPDISPLENGDHLTRDEFERRYAAMPHIKKAELIEGVVYMPSPVNHRKHGRPHSHVLGWLSTYEAATPGVEVGGNGTVRLDLDNEPQPDGYLLIDPVRGGQARIDEEGYVERAPELVAEVASSSASYDLHPKLRAYCRNGVREYLVLRVRDRALDWFSLRGAEYVPMAPDAAGLLRSEVFPGLWLDPTALVRGDLARVLAVLQDGLRTPEHAAFVERLRHAGSGVERQR